MNCHYHRYIKDTHLSLLNDVIELIRTIKKLKRLESMQNIGCIYSQNEDPFPITVFAFNTENIWYKTE